MKILEETEVRRLKRSVLLGKVAWGLVTVLLALSTFLGGEIYAIRKSKAELVAMKDELRQIQQEQQLVNDKFIEAYKNQNRLSEILLAWTDLLKTKTDIINQNRVAVKTGPNKLTSATP